MLFFLLGNCKVQQLTHVKRQSYFHFFFHHFWWVMTQQYSDLLHINKQRTVNSGWTTDKDDKCAHVLTSTRHKCRWTDLKELQLQKSGDVEKQNNYLELTKSYKTTHAFQQAQHTFQQYIKASDLRLEPTPVVTATSSGKKLSTVTANNLH